MKKLIDKTEFKRQLKDGLSIMVGGFMAVGTSEPLIELIVESGVKNLTIICNDAGYPDRGVGKLISNNQVKTLYASHIGLNPISGELMSEGKLEVHLIPQGTLVERIRAGGSGLGGVLTRTGLGTLVEENKQKISIEGLEYIVEKPLKADLAIIRGSEVDHYGNILYHATTRNFNPMMAMAAGTVVVGAEKLVDEINPNHVMTPHVFVDYIVKE
ncbi:CoA transferase subunit A [Haloplasma contractile]|uniref:Butyrate--acetoacetate CoA-transferase subunit A protein n=1 Tax=Haloplasma contractile SSD-17B TaxID=1033810 RepID=F7Q0J5_9MOLU|nr:CoA transferase subunit A [Haloplasma contractile]ERJ12660.1 Butyrate--acetoacetate CoA-transferase subunit A protein [Haloplasma contractile SSD-17B]